MAKKTGKILAAAAVTGIAVAGISYYKKYRSFNKELDKDFHDFEDGEEEPVPDSTMNRNYVSLHADKDEFLVAAGDVLTAVKGAAGAAKNVVKDAAAIVTDTARAAAAKASLNKSAGEAADEAEEVLDMAEGDVTEMKQDVAQASAQAMEKAAEKLENAAATIITEDPNPDKQ